MKRKLVVESAKFTDLNDSDIKEVLIYGGEVELILKFDSGIKETEISLYLLFDELIEIAEVVKMVKENNEN